MFVSEVNTEAMIRKVMKMSWFVLFRVIVLLQWSAVVSAISQTSTMFKVYGTGQTPVAGMEILAKLTVSSVFECGRLCWNNGDNAGCGGFLFQPQSCDGSSNSPSQSEGCQLLEFYDVNLMSFESGNTSCSARFYVSTTEARASKSATTTESARTTMLRSTLTTRSSGQTLILTKTITLNSKSVRATEQFNDELFVLRVERVSGRGQCQVTSYNATTFEPIRFSNIFSGYCEGLVGDPANNRLYFTCLMNLTVLDSNTLQETLGSPLTLPFYAYAPSKNSANNLLIPDYYGFIYEYTLSGVQVRKISTGIGTEVYQAVEGRNGTLAITLLSENDVRLISVNGTVLRSYRAAGKMIIPTGLVVDKNGYALVSDYYNGRVVALDPTLTKSSIVTFPSIGSSISAYGLWYDQSRGRLHVADGSSVGRVLIYDNVLSISDFL